MSQENEAMPGNDNGNGGGAEGEPRTSLDRLERFVCAQNADILRAFRAMNQRLDLLQVELEQLRALLGRPGDSGGGSEGSRLQ